MLPISPALPSIITEGPKWKLIEDLKLASPKTSSMTPISEISSHYWQDPLGDLEISGFENISDGTHIVKIKISNIAPPSFLGPCTFHLYQKSQRRVGLALIRVYATKSEKISHSFSIVFQYLGQSGRISVAYRRCFVKLYTIAVGLMARCFVYFRFGK